MRISDWSSDVCSSDLVPDDRDLLRSGRASCSLKGAPFSPSAFRSGSSWPSSSRRSSPGSTWASPAPSSTFSRCRGPSGIIGNSEQRAVAGGVADIHILLDDRAADRRGDRIDLKRMARLDPGQDLASMDLLAEIGSTLGGESGGAYG